MRRDPVFSLVGSVVRGDASTSGSYFANRRVPLGSVDGCVDERLFPRACSVARVLAPRRIGPSRWQQSGGELGHPPIRPPDGGRASHGRLAQRTSESPRNKKGGTSLPRVQDPRTTPSNTIGHPGNASWKRRAPRLHRQRFAGPLPVLRTGVETAPAPTALLMYPPFEDAAGTGLLQLHFDSQSRGNDGLESDLVDFIPIDAECVGRFNGFPLI